MIAPGKPPDSRTAELAGDPGDDDRLGVGAELGLEPRR
jgi:hypothetical protein